MLERASLCLESGGRHLLRGPKSHLRTRRMLHSSFWHHGAGDLDLPAWWASVHPPSLSGDNPEECSRNGTQEAFLDFLYPAKTLALMHRLSNSGWEAGQTCQGHSIVRHYSSKSAGRGKTPNDATTGPDQHSTDTPRSDAGSEDSDFLNTSWDACNIPNGGDPFPDISPMPLGSSQTSDPFDTSGDAENIHNGGRPFPNTSSVPSGSTASFDPFDTLDDAENIPSAGHSFPDVPLGGSHFDEPFDLEITPMDKKWVDGVEKPAETLRHLLEVGELDSRVIWKLWKMTRRDDRTPELSAAVLKYFCSVKPFVRTLADEVVSIFKSLDIQHRRASSYRGAVVSYVMMGKLGRAALLHDEAVRSGIAANGNVGTSDLLAHAIAKRQWQVALEAYTSMASLIGPRAQFWSAARKSLEMASLAEESLIRFRRLRLLTGKLPEEQDQIRAFAAHFGYHAICQLAPKARSAESERSLYSLVMRLRRDRFLVSQHFERALTGLLAHSSKRVIGELPVVVRKLYHMYISTAKADSFITVDAKVLYTVLHARIQTINISHGSRHRPPRLDISHILSDAVHFFRRPTNAILELLMYAFARMGEAKKVKNYYGTLPIKYRRPWHREYLLEAYARRGDTVAASKTFETLAQELGKDPHLRAWNILLNAYARNDDLVGATQVFEKLMDSSIQPDAYSFTAMLDLMSQRGDVDGVKDMFALAAEVDPNIIQTVEVAGHLVTAFVNSDDVETAEMVMEQLRQRKRSGRMEGLLLPVWNNLATAYALRRDVAGTRRIMGDMQKDGVTPDAMTYAALLQALCLSHKTDSAYKILKLVIPERVQKPLALHYAIVMAGYINEGSYEKVPFVDKLRKQRGIHPSTSTRMTVAKAVALTEHIGRYKVKPDEMMERTNKVVSDMLLKESPWEWSVEPQTGLGFRSLSQAAGAYFDIVMLIQGDRHAVDTVEHLYKVYQQHRARFQEANTKYPDESETPPVRMLVALMNAHFKAQAYGEVERLWNLAVEQVASMTQAALPRQAVRTRTDGPPANANAPMRRHLLSRPLVIYLRTLHYQARYGDAQRTVKGLLAQGYTLDNLAWNLYIQLLARTGRIRLAYSLCEEHLMPQWQGWRSTGAETRRLYRRTRGWEYMNINPNLAKRNVVMPQYRTMIFLAAALKYIRRWEAIGGGGGSGQGGEGEVAITEALLQKIAPLTMKALHGMPMLDDDLQTRFLKGD